MNDFIPVNKPLLHGNEKQYLIECVETGWISSEGQFVKRFEKEFAEYVNRKHAIAVCNGTAGLEIAVSALNLPAGSEVIMPTFTIISCAIALIRNELIPVLIDSDSITWNMDVSQIENRITAKTKAIMVVHIYGLPVDMDSVIEIANKYNLKIIEDAAEMHGQTYYGKKCGSFGDISIFSFYPNKHITTGEGGMVLCENDELADRCRSLRNLCFKKERRFVHDELGFNYRMTNMQAAIGVAQLEQIDYFIDKKRAIGKKYTQLLKNIKGIQLMPETMKYAKNIYWVFGIVLKCDLGINAEQLSKMLYEKGIGTRPFFFPMHMQPVFKKMELFKGEAYPVSEKLAEYGFYLPSGLGIEIDQIEIVVERLKEILPKDL